MITGLKSLELFFRDFFKGKLLRSIRGKADTIEFKVSDVVI